MVEQMSTDILIIHCESYKERLSLAGWKLFCCIPLAREEGSRRKITLIHLRKGDCLLKLNECPNHNRLFLPNQLFLVFYGRHKANLFSAALL